MHTKPTFAMTLVFIVLAGVLPVIAQDQENRRSELGVRQKLVERKMVELETKLTVIAERLREQEPERAKRLIAAYQQSKEKLITKKMSEVSQLLDQNQLPAAETKLDEVIENLEQLIKLLTNEKEPTISKQEEMKILERWKDNIEERMREQQAQRKETEKVSKKEETIQNLEAQIQKLKNLIDKQREVIKETEENKGAGLRALDQVADKQFEVRKGTESLNKELSGKKSDPKEGQSGDAKADDPKPGDAKPGDANSKPKKEESRDSKSEDSKSADGKSGESKSGESKPGESKPGQSKPSESESSDSPAGKEKQPAAQPPQPGQQSLKKAAEHQQRAEEKLGSGKSADAKRQEEDALKEMDKALTEIEKEKRRIESLPPEALEQMADEQRRTRDKAMELVEEMKKAPKPKSESGDQQADQQPQQQPGQQPMEQASESMKKASDDLQDQNPEEAEKKQKQSTEKMAEALKEIEERLNQLREETREEKLARLEARFREMLDRQIVASVMTVELDDKRTNLGDLGRRDQLLMLHIANEETEISEIGQQAYDLLLEDGTSIVFPEIVQELRGDLAKAAELLQEERTDRFTQLIHKEIETTIQDLLDALKEAKGKKQSSGGGGGGGGGKQPLLKTSAELKILKMQQLRLNRRTKKVDQMRGSPDLERLLDDEARAAAGLQTKLLEMTEGIMEKSDQ